MQNNLPIWKQTKKPTKAETILQFILCFISFCIVPTILFYFVLIPNFWVCFIVWFLISIFLFNIIKD